MSARYSEGQVPHSPSHPYAQDAGSYPPPFTGHELDPNSPLQHGSQSQSSLPRYNSMYQPVQGGQQPNNPQLKYKQDSRYSSFTASAGSHGQAHPLSNAMYADSTPTLQGSEVDYKEKGLPPILGSGKDSGFKRLSGAFVNGKRVSDDSDGALTVPRKARLGYLDGLKFIAAWVVLNGTLFDAAVPDSVSLQSASAHANH
jgi:hypothetical protein